MLSFGKSWSLILSVVVQERVDKHQMLLGRISTLAVGSVWRVRAMLASGLLLYAFWVDPSTGSGGLPCVWKLALGADCPACGLSRAGAHLARGRIDKAFDQNWLIIPVALLLMVYFLAPLYHRHNTRKT